MELPNQTTLNPDISVSNKNPVISAIYERRAVRKYADKGINKILIDQILDAGRMAPSAMNKQPWRFYVITDKSSLAILSAEIGKVAAEYFHMTISLDATIDQDFIFHGAPVAIFITAPKDNEWADLDIGMCSQNIMLSAKSFGLDTCPVGLAKFVEQTKSFHELDIPANERVALAIILGYGNEKASAPERKKDNVTFLT